MAAAGQSLQRLIPAHSHLIHKFLRIQTVIDDQVHTDLAIERMFNGYIENSSSIIHNRLKLIQHVLRVVIHPEHTDVSLRPSRLRFIENIPLVCRHDLFILGP